MGIGTYGSLVLAFGCAFVLSIVSIPQIIYVAKRKRLFDVPDNQRKLHTRIVPNLGGIGIFFAFIISCSLLIARSTRPAATKGLADAYYALSRWNYLVAGALILFIIGIKDDLVSISPTKKFVAQAAAAFFIAYFANIRINDLHGFLGIYEIPLWPSVTFTVVGIMFVTNAYNLIDGIDGLAGSLSALAALLFGLCLTMEGNYGAAAIAFSLMGSLCGFLWYNVAPAKIFMGDTGSLLIGYVLSVLAIMFLQSYHRQSFFATIVPTNIAIIPIALAILFVPIFDTFRVFTMRILKGRSPFRPDRTHLHHYLLDLGFGHTATVAIILAGNIVILAVCALVYRLSVHTAVFSLLATAFGLFTIIFFVHKSRRNPVAVAQADVQRTARIEKLRNALRRVRGSRQTAVPQINVANLTINGTKIELNGVAASSRREELSTLQ